MDEIKVMLQTVFNTKNQLTMPISAPGSAGMESCFVNLVEPGDEVLVGVNGVFGGRMVENVRRLGGKAIVVESPWGEAITPQQIAAALNANPNVKIVAFVHAETSTGVLSDAKAICQEAKSRGLLTIVDMVTSLAGAEVKVDDWGIDAAYSGSQKCLACVPGLSPVTFSPKAIEAIKNRKSEVTSWFLDNQLIMAYWGNESERGGARSYHHTAPVNALYALHESLRLLLNEGLTQSEVRHKNAHLALVAGLESMGLVMLVDQAHRLPQLNTVKVPSNIDEAKVRKELLQEHGLEIGAGLGTLAGKVWRIGLMGENANIDKVVYCLDKLSRALSNQGYELGPNMAGLTAKKLHDSLL
jgi:alanine-glyoxylate transaminase/serine-glyoxylate transaminase/serine-pyruvate transaminase